jgi:hypothetical protein
LWPLSKQGIADHRRVTAINRSAGRHGDNLANCPQRQCRCERGARRSMMRLVKISDCQYINVDAITDVYIGDDHTLIRFAAPDFNQAYEELPTQPHRIELAGAPEEHFRRWLEANSEDATKRRRHAPPAELPQEQSEEV